MYKGGGQERSSWHEEDLLRINYGAISRMLTEKPVGGKEAKRGRPRLKSLPKVDIVWSAALDDLPAGKLPLLTPSVGSLQKPPRPQKPVAKITLELPAPRADPRRRGQRQQTLPPLGVRSSQRIPAEEIPLRKGNFPQRPVPPWKEALVISSGMDPYFVTTEEGKKTSRASPAAGLQAHKEDIQPKRAPGMVKKTLDAKPRSRVSLPIPVCSVFMGVLEPEPAFLGTEPSVFAPTLRPHPPRTVKPRPAGTIPATGHRPLVSPLQGIVGRKCHLHPR